MPSVVVYNQLGTEVGQLELSDSVYAFEPNMQAVYDVVKAQRAGMRQGTHKTKTRAEVRGGGRKPWRQKGTGRARHGSIRSPQWVGGGIVFGPTPRDYSFKVNRKVVKTALKSILSSRLQENNLVVLDKLVLDSHQTKGLVQVLENLKLNGKIVIVTLQEDSNLFLAGRNIPNVYVQTKDHLSVYELANSDVIVLTEEVAKKYEEDLA
ncbi:MAG: 50S ribosomal protein L4 [Acholeplasmataceae bacterium]|nr:50S ribosomal protein L4 [Acholeplasmataceae bacterium]HOA63254.1 50S ribosomal protein L4 [Bacilli bacterium]HQA19316.1 50S ribosomal protein L4 [Bacilli bacterium]HQD91939.1 50S ribosomal protein L4 [Bacilli bacterium]